MNIYVIIFLIIIFFWILLVIKFRKSYKISDSKKRFFRGQLKKISSSVSYKEQVVDMDKLYHKILLEAGYNWTFWEILKQEPSEISNLNKIWELHKLRNKLVHDFDNVSETVLKNKALEYNKEVRNLLQYF